MSYTIEGLGYGVFVKDTATSQIKYFFGVSTALKFERDNLGIFLNSQNVDAVGGFLLLTNSVDNTEENGIITPFDNSDPNATKNLFIFISQNLQGGSAVPVTNIWTQSAGEVLLVDTNQSLVLGDLAQANLTPAYFNFNDSKSTPVWIIQNSGKTNLTKKFQNRTTCDFGVPVNVLEIPTDANTCISGLLSLNCTDVDTGLKQYSGLWFISSLGTAQQAANLISELVDPGFAPFAVSAGCVAGSFFVEITNLDAAKINVNLSADINLNKI